MTGNTETFQSFMTGARVGRRLTNSIGRNSMTRERLQGLIRQGFGQGRGDQYVPWIRITRGNAPRMSNHVVAVTNIDARPHHLLSRLEYGALRLAVWLGAQEIREQFPQWPWAGGSHPMAGLDTERDQSLPTAPGLLNVAARAKIKHGTYVGAPDLPYVATTDLLIRLGAPPNDRLVSWSCKPAAVLACPKAGPRAKERIELDRLFAAAIGAHHAIYDGTQASKVLLANLDWLEPTRAELREATLIGHRAAFASAFNGMPCEASIESRIAMAAARLNFDRAAAQQHFRAAAWQGAIDADLSQAIVMSKPLKTGGNRLKRQLRQQLMGELQ